MKHAKNETCKERSMHLHMEKESAVAAPPSVPRKISHWTLLYFLDLRSTPAHWHLELVNQASCAVVFNLVKPHMSVFFCNEALLTY